MLKSSCSAAQRRVGERCRIEAFLFDVVLSNRYFFLHYMELERRKMKKDKIEMLCNMILFLLSFSVFLWRIAIYCWRFLLYDFFYRFEIFQSFISTLLLWWFLSNKIPKKMCPFCGKVRIFKKTFQLEIV